jgi:hypothetical protein
MQESDINVWEMRMGIRVQGKAIAGSFLVYTCRAGDSRERGHLWGPGLER